MKEKKTFFIVECQLISIERMIKLKHQHFVSLRITDLGKMDIKITGKKLLRYLYR